MKHFIIKSISFLIFTLVVVLGVCTVYYFQIQKSLVFPENIDTIILGDSHTENGLNDSIIHNSRNLSNAAESYMYTYAKLKFVAQNNKNVKYAIIALSGHNVSDGIEKIWLFQKENVFSRYGSLFPFMSFDDFKYIIRNGSIRLAGYIIHGSIYNSINNLERQILLGKSNFIGGYTANQKNYSENKDAEQLLNHSENYSKYQITYLKRIVTFCNENNIKLIFINTPIYNKKVNDKLNLEIFDHSKYLYLDYSTMDLDSTSFADQIHLNSTGAESFSIIVNSKLIEFRNASD